MERLQPQSPPFTLVFLFFKEINKKSFIFYQKTDTLFSKANDTHFTSEQAEYFRNNFIQNTYAFLEQLMQLIKKEDLCAYVPIEHFSIDTILTEDGVLRTYAYPSNMLFETVQEYEETAYANEDYQFCIGTEGLKKWK